MWDRLKRRREYRDLVRETTTELLVELGPEVWNELYSRSRDRDRSDSERQFLYAVRTEVERCIGREPHVDTATRYLR